MSDAGLCISKEKWRETGLQSYITALVNIEPTADADFANFWFTFCFQRCAEERGRINSNELP